MMGKTGIGFATAVCLVAGGLATASAVPAKAQNFFDQLFGSSRNYDRGGERYYRQRNDGYNWGRRDSGYNDSYRWSRQSSGYDPEAVRVSAPKYYEYKPDVLKRFSLAGLAQVETASADETQPLMEKTPFVEARGHLSAMSIRTLPEVAEAIKAWYAKEQRFVWVSDGRVNTLARTALEALSRADLFGLSPEDYRVDVPAEDFDPADPSARQEALMRFEMEMSAKVLAYALDAARGRIDPNRISGYHDFVRNKVDLAGALTEMSGMADVGGWLDGRNPDNAPFRALVAELAALRASDDGPRVEIASDTFLRPGTVNPELANVTAAIRLRASADLKFAHATTLAGYADGAEYTPALVALVRAFQTESGLKPDGIVGKGTIGVLTFRSVQDKMDKVTLAMERLRWLPRNLGARHVFVNQPAFQASYMEEGKQPLTMKVVVGTKANQTYFFMDKIETVEFNPYWGVPLSIIVNEMLPKLDQNPYYLDQIGYEVTTPQGQRISSGQVDWYAVATKRTSVNVRQLPGGDNALGELKILFPNAHAIYMHDTPAKELFTKPTRAFSHGCIRLENPRAMAAAVLGKSVDYIASRVAQGQNESDQMTANVPVYVSYFTAWPGTDGKVRYYDDMYERDIHLARAIDRTNRARQIEG
jgi:murein L,D-transpeptidase YcbB/YkuD